MGNDYFATGTGDEEERRLAGLEQNWDEITQRRIQALGIEPGWRCLEVAAGRGSIARWLRDRVGSGGHVVAADLNPRFLQGQDFEAIELDIRKPGILPAASFDLVHTRALLMHLLEPLDALQNMAAAVRSGGWLLIEEPDMMGLRAIDASTPSGGLFDRVWSGICKSVAESRVMDPRFGPKLPGLVETLGFKDTQGEVVSQLVYDETPETKAMYGQTGQILGPQAVASGHLLQEDLDEFKRTFGTEPVPRMASPFWGVWARRP